MVARRARQRLMPACCSLPADSRGLPEWPGDHIPPGKSAQRKKKGDLIARFIRLSTLIAFSFDSEPMYSGGHLLPSGQRIRQSATCTSPWRLCAAASYVSESAAVYAAAAPAVNRSHLKHFRALEDRLPRALDPQQCCTEVDNQKNGHQPSPASAFQARRGVGHLSSHGSSAGYRLTSISVFRPL